MKIDKVKKQLNKINNLFTSIEEEGEVSKIEKALLKTYIMELYERVATTEEKETVSKPAKVKQKDHKNKPESSTNSIFSAQENKVPVATETLEKVIERELQSATNGSSSAMEMETVIDISDEGGEETPKENRSSGDQHIIDTIFQAESGTELSEKLSKLPIKDLNKAIGLNEKIFTINELFKGNGAHYQEVMKSLNELKSFDEAKDYMLKHIVDRYEWTEESKVKKAANFVKIIQRRYL